VTPTLVYGDQVCVRKDVSVSANSTLEVILPWFPPNPGDYNTFGDPNHFCILARLYTGCGITGETTVTYMNNVLSKQVAQRNVTVVDQLPGIVFPPRGQIYDVFAQNVDNATRTIKFEFVGRDNAHSENFFDYGHAFMYMDPDLYDAWTTGGSVGTGVTDLGNNLVEIDQNNANIRNISFDAYQQFGNGMRFTYFSQDNDTLDFDVDVIEKKTALGQADVVFGGERYVISPVECPAAQVVNDHIDIDNGCGADLEVDDPKSGVEYTWYDENGDEAGEGSATTVYPTATTYYVLKAAQKGCILTDTVFVSVNDHECNGRLAHHPAGPGTSKWISIQPNPSAGSTTIICNLAEGEAGEFSLLNMYGEVVYSVTVSGKTRVILDASQFANGIYNCVLSGKGTGIITQRLTVSH
jgi:hypothetical protein